MGKVGTPVGAKSFEGADLHVGDIVLIYSAMYLGTDIEQWYQQGITAIVSKQFESFTDGSIKLTDGHTKGFVMGIASCGFNSPDWRIEVVKSHVDVIEGEHWPAYGFNYRKNAAADALIAERNAS
jgi:hypothetical protein